MQNWLFNVRAALERLLLSETNIVSASIVLRRRYDSSIPGSHRLAAVPHACRVLPDISNYRLLCIPRNSRCATRGSFAIPLLLRRSQANAFPAQEMDALFGDESIEKDDDEEDDDDKDDDGEEDASSFTGSGTPGSSMRSASPSSFRRKNSSTPLVGNGGPVSMMKRMFANMRRKETGGGYDQLDH